MLYNGKLMMFSDLFKESVFYINILGKFSKVYSLLTRYCRYSTVYCGHAFSVKSCLEALTNFFFNFKAFRCMSEVFTFKDNLSSNYKDNGF